MDIEKLEHFLVFTEYLNFTAAANKLFMDPSVFHRQISSIEQELGVRLIARDNRVMRLTPAGESFAAGVRSVLELYRAEVLKAVSLESGVQGTIRICTIVGHSLSERFADALNRFSDAYPRVRIVLLSKSITESRRLFQQGQVDLVAARTEDFAFIEDMDALEIQRVPVGFAVHCGLLPKDAAGQPAFDEAVLDRIPLVWGREQQLSRLSDQYIQDRQKRLGPDSVLIVSDMDATFTMTEAKKGFTLMNDLCYFRNQPGICYVRSDRFQPHSHSLMRKRSNANPSAALFWDCMREQFPPCED